MANKNHALDGRIIEAAKAEFLEFGYQKASLHKIAQRAGTTTGALYTRYKGKDDLFVSLIRDAFASMEGKAAGLRGLYEKAHDLRTPEALLSAIRVEEKLYFELLFAHYDECVLFFCKSGGSSVEGMLRAMMKRKAEETAAYISTLSQKPFQPEIIELVMEGQFHLYRQILERGCGRDKARALLEEMRCFTEAGWKALFEEIL